MPASTRLLALLTVFLAGRENAIVSSRRIRNLGVSDESRSGEGRYEDFSLDKTAAKRVFSDPIGDSKSSKEELHIEKNDFIDVSWKKQRPDLFRVKRRTATIALDVKDNTYRVWTHVYPPTAVAAIPAVAALPTTPAVPAVPYGVATMHPGILPVDLFYPGYPVMLGGVAPAPLSPYGCSFFGGNPGLPYATLPWASPFAGPGFLGPDTAAVYLPGYPDAAGYYSALPDLSWAGLDPADYLQ